VTFPATTKSWQLPAVEDILDPATPVMIQENVDYERAKLIEETLLHWSSWACVSIQRGPTITQYGIEPDYIESRNGRTRVRVSKIANLADDLALALAATRIRIQAPVPDTAMSALKCQTRRSARFRSWKLLTANPSRNCVLPFGCRWEKMWPATDRGGSGKHAHLLIAGTTGSW
jgi:S-DNA-T family DNA segregation ATPase FtsK/SpoIIIE